MKSLNDFYHGCCKCNVLFIFWEKEVLSNAVNKHEIRQGCLKFMMKWSDVLDELA